MRPMSQPERHDLLWSVGRAVWAKQQSSWRSLQDLKARFESRLSPVNCQTFSTGFNPGHLGGSGLGDNAGHGRRREPCHLA